MKKILVVTLVSVMSSLSFADCRPSYQAALQCVEAKATNSKNGALDAGGAAGIAVVGLAVSAGMAATPLVMASSGIIMGVIQHEIDKKKVDGIRSLLYLINEAYVGSGVQTQRFVRQLSKNGVLATYDQVDLWIHYANENNLLCPVNEVTGEQKLLSQKQIFQAMRGELVMADDETTR